MRTMGQAVRVVSLSAMQGGLAAAALGGCAALIPPGAVGSPPDPRSWMPVHSSETPRAGSGPGIRPLPLTAQPGDAQRGRAIVADRTRGMCLLCHEGPFPEIRQGNLAPTLDGAGSRLSEAQLRARIMDARAIHPASIMPAYHQTEGQVQVAPALRGQPLLAAQEIEDVVAFLMTLRDASPSREGMK